MKPRLTRSAETGCQRSRQLGAKESQETPRRARRHPLGRPFDHLPLSSSSHIPFRLLGLAGRWSGKFMAYTRNIIYHNHPVGSSLNHCTISPLHCFNMHSVFLKVADPYLVFFLAILTGKCLLSFVSLCPKAEACVESVDVMFCLMFHP